MDSDCVQYSAHTVMKTDICI